MDIEPTKVTHARRRSAVLRASLSGHGDQQLLPESRAAPRLLPTLSNLVRAVLETMMAEQLPRGLYTLISLAMIAALVCDFIWVARTALHAMH